MIYVLYFLITKSDQVSIPILKYNVYRGSVWLAVSNADFIVMTYIATSEALVMVPVQRGIKWILAVQMSQYLEDHIL